MVRIGFKKAFGKALEWRSITLAIDFALAYLLTQEVVLSAKIVSLTASVKVVAQTLWLRTIK